MIKNPWKEAKALRVELAHMREHYARESRVSFTLTVAMHDIVACETHRSNATVKRCVSIARAALEAVR
tara:strand:- start:298 stop:501 length:204 start_codon:yes stop_codon:yes gene_type:complete